jgi:ABC-2 type transport system permease protein
MAANASGAFLSGLFILLWSCTELQLPLISSKCLIILLSIIGTSCLFYELIVVQATISVCTTETLELMNITTYGGVETGQYPMSIYNSRFQFFFTIIIPLTCVAYYPVATPLHHNIFPL